MGGSDEYFLAVFLVVVALGLDDGVVDIHERIRDDLREFLYILVLNHGHILDGQLMKGLVGPRIEPVDRAAIDDVWILNYIITCRILFLN